jgi:cell division protein FtsL
MSKSKSGFSRFSRNEKIFYIVSIIVVISMVLGTIAFAIS